MNNFPIRLILSDLRSTANVGSLLRTADALGVELVYAAGYTPYPKVSADRRPPHIAASNHRSIAKTALGAEQTVPIQTAPDTATAVQNAHRAGFTIVMLEQSPKAKPLSSYTVNSPITLVLGNEVSGISPEDLALADTILEIPMLGHKESYGVAVAGGIALYQLRYGSSLSCG